MHVFFLGWPGGMGGANTEALHTAAIWRKHGIEVTWLPTWTADKPMRNRVESMGCKVVDVANREALPGVPGIRGAVVVAFCNNYAWRSRQILLDLGCKFVASNCMTFLFAEEMEAWSIAPAEAYHFQSDFQRRELEPLLISYGYTPNRGHLIRGAFAFDDVPFAPRGHSAGEDFVVGRLSRPDLDKWSSNHWPILWKVPYAKRRALCMGWTPDTQRKVGQPPPWAECLRPQQIPIPEFLGRCHAMLGLNGGARENWPRIGLEAMAAGVPVVAQRLWGWPEMIHHNYDGLLFDSDEECEYLLAKLAYDEDFREGIIHRAYKSVQELADPERIGRQWKELFASLGA